MIADIIRDILRRETGGIPFAAARADLHPADRGGWTRAGITAVNAGAFLGLDRPATPEELDALTEAQALEFYAQRYVRPYAYVPEPLQSLLVDWAVTSWHDDPTKALQTALVRRGVYAGRIDGVAGSQTKAAVIADPDARQTYREVFTARLRYMLHVAFDAEVRDFLRTHPRSQLANLRGWVHRSLEFVP